MENHTENFTDTPEAHQGAKASVIEKRYAKKNSFRSLQMSLENQVAQELSNAQSLDKEVLNAQPCACQARLSHYLARTIVPVRMRIVERRGDNMLYCKESGQKLPSTPEGNLDMEQLSLEISQKKLIGF